MQPLPTASSKCTDLMDSWLTLLVQSPRRWHCNISNCAWRIHPRICFFEGIEA